MAVAGQITTFNKPYIANYTWRANVRPQTWILYGKKQTKAVRHTPSMLEGMLDLCTVTPSNKWLNVCPKDRIFKRICNEWQGVPPVSIFNLQFQLLIFHLAGLFIFLFFKKTSFA